MDEDERDYDQETFEQALRALINDPRSHDVDVRHALAVQLCIEISPESDLEYEKAKDFVLWAIKGLLLCIEAPNSETNQIKQENDDDRHETGTSLRFFRDRDAEIEGASFWQAS